VRAHELTENITPEQVLQDQDAMLAVGICIARKRRWPAAEEFIINDAKAADKYCHSVMGGNWPEYQDKMRQVSAEIDQLYKSQVGKLIDTCMNIVPLNTDVPKRLVKAINAAMAGDIEMFKPSSDSDIVELLTTDGAEDDTFLEGWWKSETSTQEVIWDDEDLYEQGDAEHVVWLVGSLFHNMYKALVVEPVAGKYFNLARWKR
jgi:hypothetical protein